jgi:hypothetical protein
MRAVRMARHAKRERGAALAGLGSGALSPHLKATPKEPPMEYLHTVLVFQKNM